MGTQKGTLGIQIKKGDDILVTGVQGEEVSFTHNGVKARMPKKSLSSFELVDEGVDEVLGKKYTKRSASKGEWGGLGYESSAELGVAMMRNAKFAQGGDIQFEIENIRYLMKTGTLALMQGTKMIRILTPRHAAYLRGESIDNAAALLSEAIDQEIYEEFAVTLDEAKPQGKMQKALMAVLQARPVHLTDLVRSAAFRGVHFASIMSAAETLAKKGLAMFDGSKISLVTESVDEAFEALLEDKNAHGMEFVERQLVSMYDDEDEATRGTFEEWRSRNFSQSLDEGVYRVDSLEALDAAARALPKAPMPGHDSAFAKLYQGEFGDIDEAKSGIVLTVEQSKKDRGRYRMKISGSVGKISIRGEVRPVYMGLERQEISLQTARDVTTVNRADGFGKDLSFGTRLKVEKAVHVKLLELQAGYSESTEPVDEASNAQLKSKILTMVGQIDTHKRSGNTRKEQAAHDKLVAFTQEHDINFDNALSGARKLLNKKNPIGRKMSGFESVDEARLSTKDPMTMTAAQINKELAKLDKASSKLTSSFIEAGRGHERFSDIAKAKDPLALEMVAVTNRQGVLRDEGKARYGPKLIGNLPTHQRGKFGPRKKNEDVDEAVAPQGARVVKGVYYFKDRKVALAWAAANGWPPRVLGFDKGYVVQAGPSGSYAGPGQKPKEWKGYADFLRTKDESIDEHDVQYQSLNDAANYGDGYKKGSTEVWYARDSAMRNLVMGMDFLRKNAPEAVPTTKTYKTTHRLVGKVAEKSPDRVFGMMQGERWSPDGEARTMLAKQGLHHTSMSVGDIVRIGTKVLFADRNGFTSLS